MSSPEEVLDAEPPSIDPYDVLDLETTATADEVKRAYRKAALKNHPGTIHQSSKLPLAHHALTEFIT